MKPTSECVLWEGYTDRQGYGKVSREGRKSILLHRYLYEQEHGPQPGLQIHHTCENKRCINLDHLIAVTDAEHRRLEQALRTHCRRGHPYAIFGRPERGTARRCVACRGVRV